MSASATRTAAALLAALALAGCGGGDDDGDDAARTQPATTADAPPTATTGEPPGARRGPPPGETLTPRAGARYECDGRPLRALRPDGPVRVVPPVVEPGQRFRVEVTEPGARVAIVSLAGVSDVPISAEARSVGGRLAATLEMPDEATCGNKLLTIEGDVAAEAHVAVRR